MVCVVSTCAPLTGAESYSTRLKARMAGICRFLFLFLFCVTLCVYVCVFSWVLEEEMWLERLWPVTAAFLVQKFVSSFPHPVASLYTEHIRHQRNWHPEDQCVGRTVRARFCYFNFASLLLNRDRILCALPFPSTSLLLQPFPFFFF